MRASTISSAARAPSPAPLAALSPEFVLQPTPDTSFDAARWAAMRYFNLFRLIIAAAFLTAGRMLELGQQAPTLVHRRGGSLPAGGAPARLSGRRTPFGPGPAGYPASAGRCDRTDDPDVSSGGYRSGIPLLMLVVLAGAGLAAEGRMVLFYAALATVRGPRAESAVRLIGGARTDFFSVGLLCIGSLPWRRWRACWLCAKPTNGSRSSAARTCSASRRSMSRSSRHARRRGGALGADPGAPVQPSCHGAAGAWFAEGEPLFRPPSGREPGGVDFADPHQCRVELRKQDPAVSRWEPSTTPAMC